MAPEAVSRQHYGKGCDIWGGGVLLHVLLSGRLPFLGSGNRLKDVISRGRVAVLALIHKSNIIIIFTPFLSATMYYYIVLCTMANEFEQIDENKNSDE